MAGRLKRITAALPPDTWELLREHKDDPTLSALLRNAVTAALARKGYRQDDVPPIARRGRPAKPGRRRWN
jgi:hypothetical protein